MLQPSTIGHRIAAMAIAAAVVTTIGGCASSTTQTPPSMTTPTALSLPTLDTAIVDLERDLTAQFGSLTFSTIRDGDSPEHSKGLALDVLIPQWDTAGGRELGDAIAAWVAQRAERYRVQYLAWGQHYYQSWVPGAAPTLMEDRGSPTQNYLDHLHVSVTPSGDLNA